MIDFKKIPFKGGVLKVGLPAFILVAIGCLIGKFSLAGLGAYLGLILLMNGFAVLKYRKFLNNSEELSYEEAPEILSIVSSASEYFDVEVPELRTFASDYEEVFTVGLKRPYYIMISDKAQEKLDVDELQFLILEEFINIAKGRMVPLTVFAPDGRTSGMGHFFIKWISGMELNNDKIALAFTKNLELCIRTIIKVNDYNEESEMSINDIVNIFINARKSQLQNITEALDLDEYIIKRIVELLKFSRSRDYKKLSDSIETFEVDYGVEIGGNTQKQKNETHVEEEIRVDEKPVKKEKMSQVDDENMYKKVMGDVNYDFIHNDIEVDIEKEAEAEFADISQKYEVPRNRAYDEVAATDDKDDFENTTVLGNKYNIVGKGKKISKEENDEFDEYDRYDDNIDAERKKKFIIIAITAAIALILVLFGVKTLLDKAGSTGGTKPGTETGDTDKIDIKDLDETFVKLITDFRNAWSKLVKEGEVSYEQYVDGAFKEELAAVKSNGNEIEYTSIKLDSSKFTNEEKTSAQIQVSEKLKLLENGVESNKEFVNIYLLNKVKDEWKITSCIESEKTVDPNEEDDNDNSQMYKDSSFNPNLSYKYSAIPNSERMNGEEGQRVANIVVAYNDTWIKYINEGSRDIFNYMMKDQDAYNDAIKFKNKPSNKNLKESFELMEIKDVRKTSAAFYVWTHEKIKEDRDGKVQVKEYHWIHMLRKQGDSYVIQESFKDPAYK